MFFWKIIDPKNDSRKSKNHSTFVDMAISTNLIIRCENMYHLHFESVIFEFVPSIGLKKGFGPKVQVNIIVVLSSLFFWQPQTCHMTDSRCNWYMMSHLIIELVLIAILTKFECFWLFLSHNWGQLSSRKNKLLFAFSYFI